jgi:hypothetical protein
MHITSTRHDIADITCVGSCRTPSRRSDAVAVACNHCATLSVRNFSHIHTNIRCTSLLAVVVVDGLIGEFSRLSSFAH